MRSLVTVLACLVWCSVGCKSKSSSESAPLPSASSASSASSAPPNATTPPLPSAVTALPPPDLPEGPSLAIIPGKGVGSIRLGATVATIERLMEAPCEVKTPELCRYVRRAVEFHLDKAGATDRITVHRHDRTAGVDAAGKPVVYGFFNGAIPPGAMLGMIPSAIVEFLGKPTRTEAVDTKNDNQTIERVWYPGLLLEFDRYTNGKIMLGAVVIEKEGR